MRGRETSKKTEYSLPVAARTIDAGDRGLRAQGVTLFSIRRFGVFSGSSKAAQHGTAGTQVS